MENIHTEQIMKIILNLGLEERQVAIYLAALQTGGGTITELARAGQIERSGIYYHIDNLIKHGLLRTMQRGRRNIYLPADPSQLKTIVEKLEQNLLKILPQLQTQYSREVSKSIVEYYEGVEEVDNFYDRVYELLVKLPAEENEIYVLGQSFRAISGANSKLLNYQPPKIQLNVKTKAILPKSQKSKDPKENAMDPYIVTRYNLPEAERRYIRDKYLYFGSFVITRNLIISYDAANLFFSITENKNMAATWRMFFEFIWEHLLVEK